MAFVNPPATATATAVGAARATTTAAAAATMAAAVASDIASRGGGGGGGRTGGRGAFVVLEGVDRCGKTTQSSMLLRHLNLPDPGPGERPNEEEDAGGDGSEQQDGAPSRPPTRAVAMRFPDRTTPIGLMIDSYLRSSAEMDDRAIHLLFSANRWEAVPLLTKTLAQGTHVICDRYAYSGVAFSSSKVDGDGHQVLGMDWCRAPDVGLPAPDLVLFLELNEEEAERRGGYGGERYERRDVQRRVRKRFDELRSLDEEDQGGAPPNGHRVPWRVVDASRTPEEVHAEIRSAVEETVRRVTTTSTLTSSDGGGDGEGGAAVGVGGGAPLYKLWDDGVFDLPSPPSSRSEEEAGPSKESTSTSPRSVVAGGEAAGRCEEAAAETTGKDVAVGGDFGDDDDSVPPTTDDGARV